MRRGREDQPFDAVPSGRFAMVIFTTVVGRPSYNVLARGRGGADHAASGPLAASKDLAHARGGVTAPAEDNSLVNHAGDRFEGPRPAVFLSLPISSARAGYGSTGSWSHGFCQGKSPFHVPDMVGPCRQQSNGILWAPHKGICRRPPPHPQNGRVGPCFARFSAHARQEKHRLEPKIWVGLAGFPQGDQRGTALSEKDRSFRL